MLGWKDVMMKQEQYKDLLREAEHRALVQKVVMDRKRRAFLQTMLATGSLTLPRRRECRCG